jgi:hypothetical protein
MTRTIPLLLTIILSLIPFTAAAQAPPNRHEIALEIGYVAGGVSYAQRVGETPFSVGAGAWGAWEPANTFEEDFYEPLGVVVFGRYHGNLWAADLGLTAARYLSADDCSDCSGTFYGVRSVVLLGRGAFYIGPELSAGWNGSEFGVVGGAQVRFVYGWGRQAPVTKRDAAGRRRI